MTDGGGVRARETTEERTCTSLCECCEGVRAHNTSAMGADMHCEKST